MPKLTIGQIAEIRKALQVIQVNAEVTCFNIIPPELYNREKETMHQVKRINGLLPTVKVEGAKK